MQLFCFKGDEILKDSKFLDISFDVLLFILSLSQMNASEIEVSMALRKWEKKNQKEIADENLATVFSKIHFQYIWLSDLAEIGEDPIEFCRWICNCKTLLKTFSKLQSNQHFLPRYTFRKCSFDDLFDFDDFSTLWTLSSFLIDFNTLLPTQSCTFKPMQVSFLHQLFFD